MLWTRSTEMLVMSIVFQYRSFFYTLDTVSELDRALSNHPRTLYRPTILDYTVFRVVKCKTHQLNFTYSVHSGRMGRTRILPAHAHLASLVGLAWGRLRGPTISPLHFNRSQYHNFLSFSITSISRIPSNRYIFLSSLFPVCRLGFL